MTSLITPDEIVILKKRQHSIADDMYNQEFEFEDEVHDAESSYFSGINLLYGELGEDAPCSEIDPLLYKLYADKTDKPDLLINRRNVMIKLGRCH